MGGSVFKATLAGSSATLNVFGTSSGGNVYSAYASGVWFQAGGQMLMGYYAQVDSVDVESGYIFVSSGGLLQHASIGGTTEKSGQVYLKPWGVGISNTVSSNGIMLVSSAGTATSTLVQSGGSAVASSGGLITGGSVLAGGSFSVLTGGSADNTGVGSGGILVASTGGKCAKTTVASGRILVFSGGTATETTMQAGTATIYGESDSGTYNGGKVIVTGGFSIKEKLLGGEMHVSASGTED